MSHDSSSPDKSEIPSLSLFLTIPDSPTSSSLPPLPSPSSSRSSSRTTSLSGDMSDIESQTSSEEGRNVRRSCCKYLRNIFKSNIYEYIVLILIGIDCVLVLAEVIHETKSSNNSPITGNAAVGEHLVHVAHENPMHIASLILTSFFAIEIVLKTMAFGMKYTVTYLWLDVIVVTVSGINDFPSSGTEHHLTSLDFIRIWRVVRIIYAIIYAAKAPLVHNIEKLERKVKLIQKQLEVVSQKCNVSMPVHMKKKRNFFKKAISTLNAEDRFAAIRSSWSSLHSTNTLIKAESAEP